MSSFLRSICQMMTSEEADGKMTTYGQTNDDFHQTVLERSERRAPVHLRFTPHDRSVDESCTSCQMALNELQQLRKRLQEECACKSSDRSERREIVPTNMETASTKEDELFDVIDSLKLSLEKAKERQFGLQQQLMMERALRIEAIRMIEELQMKLTRQLCSHDRQENLSWEERNRLGSNDDDADNTIPTTTKTTTTDQLQSLTSAADKVDATYAKMEFVCSRCQKRERQTTQTTLPLQSIDRPSLPLRSRTAAVDAAAACCGGRLAAGRPGAAAAGFLHPSSAIAKAKSERITAVDDQRLPPDLHHRKQISNLIMKPDSAGSDGILMAPTTTTTVQDTGRETRMQDVAESRESALENSIKELQNIRNKETMIEFAKECSVSFGAGPDDEMSSIPLLTQESPSDNLGKSKTPEKVLVAERNAKTLEPKWSNSSSSITSRLPNACEKQKGKPKAQDDVAKRSSKGKTATVTVSSNGSVTTYSGSNLSLWMQFGGGNEPEKIVAKQVKPYRLKKYQKQTADHQKFVVEATALLRSGENQAGQPKPRNNKKELVFRRLKNRDFVDTDDTESYDQTIERQSTLFDMDVVKVYDPNDDNQAPKERLHHNADSKESNKSSPSNSHQSSIFSKSTSIQSEIETAQPVHNNNSSRNQQYVRTGPPPSQENQAPRIAFESSAIAKEASDNTQLVIDSVKEYCSFQIPVSLTTSPDLDNSSNPDNSVPSDVVFDSVKRAEKVPQADPTKPITFPADTRNANADSYSARCKAYRTYLETLAEKIQTRELKQSAPPRFDYYKRRQGKSTDPTEQSSCKTPRPDAAAAEFSGLETTNDIKEPISLSKLHFISDESMITYLSGIRTNLQSKYMNAKTFSNQTMDHVNPRCAVGLPLSNEEITKERLQPTSREAKPQTISDQNQPTKTGTAPVLSGADNRGIETMRRVESPADDVFHAATEEPIELDDQRLSATGNAQIISNDIRHHYVSIRSKPVDASLDKDPTTAHRPNRRIPNLPEVDRAVGGSVASAVSAADNKKPVNDVVDGGGGGQRASPEASSGRVAQLKVMAASVEAPSIWITKSPHDLLNASSAADRVVLSSGSCETAAVGRQCECRARKTRAVSPSSDRTASDVQNEEDEDVTTAERGEATKKHPLLRSTDDDTSITPSSSVSPNGLLLAVVVAPQVSGGTGVGASTGGRDMVLDREQKKPD